MESFLQDCCCLRNICDDLEVNEYAFQKILNLYGTHISNLKVTAIKQFILQYRITFKKFRKIFNRYGRSSKTKEYLSRLNN